MLKSYLQDWPNVLSFPFRGVDFSKFVVLFRSALQILLADNIKGLKTQPTSQHQERKE
jgi:hypothetical protein